MGVGDAAMSGLPRERGFWDRALKIIARHTQGRGDPEELLNSAFLRLERYRASNAVKNPTAFLVRAAKNIVIDEFRHEKILTRYQADSAHRDRDDFPLQDEVFAARARLERVKEGLDQLPVRTREIFLMYRLDDLKCREIANRVGISESAVEKHIAKAMYFLNKWAEGW
jgi:RNA polymerase sigma factor (sigma-70 family)